MAYRDENGHFISREEAESRGITGHTKAPEVEAQAAEEVARQGWTGGNTATPQTVLIETGRGQTEEVRVGSPFQPTIERIAEAAHYGGYFRVFLNGEELVNPEDSPETIQPGMRIALTSYDKVG